MYAFTARHTYRIDRSRQWCVLSSWLWVEDIVWDAWASAEMVLVCLVSLRDRKQTRGICQHICTGGRRIPVPLKRLLQHCLADFFQACTKLQIADSTLLKPSVLICFDGFRQRWLLHDLMEGSLFINEYCCKPSIVAALFLLCLSLIDHELLIVDTWAVFESCAVMVFLS